jgi:arylsulfatase A-like enzyme
LFLAKAGGNVYRAEVEEVDDAVGNVLNVAGPETLVVFMSDNGGTVHGSNAPLRGFKGGYLEGGVRVPMIWHWPGHIPAGVVNSKIVSVMDLLPTLVKAVGGTVQQPGIDGHDIMPNLLMNSRPSPYNAYRYYAIGNWFKVKAIRSGDFKLNLVTGALYNLRTDQKELRNVAGANPTIVKKLKALAR